MNCSKNTLWQFHQPAQQWLKQNEIAIVENIIRISILPIMHTPIMKYTSDIEGNLSLKKKEYHNHILLLHLLLFVLYHRQNNDYDATDQPY